MQHIYDVVIIGAGSAGLGASYSLTQHKVEHLILESRDRIGGRILASQFQGLAIEVGASFVHCPHNDNQIYQMMKQLKWKEIPAQFDNELYLHETMGKLTQKIINKAEELYDKLTSSIDKVSENSNHDISMWEAAKPFLSKQLNDQPQQIKDTVNWKLQIQANVEGAQLTEMSAWDQTQGESEKDVLPAGGYASLFQAIFNLCQPVLKLNQKVIQIDYQTDTVKIVTTHAVYRARKVIASLPLGILKSKSVEFVPALPNRHMLSIQNIGNGVANKLFVSFAAPFWPQNKVWINFVTAQSSHYPVAFNLSDPKKGIYVLCVFVSGSAATLISEWSDQQIAIDFCSFLKKFVTTQQIQLKKLTYTRWNKDEHSLGSYSFINVGTTKQDLKELKKPVNNKLWLVGQHCHPQMNACVHSAYQTGSWAAKEVMHSLKK